MSDAPDPRVRRRIRWAVALLLLGLLGAAIPPLVAGSGSRTVVYLFTTGNRPTAASPVVLTTDLQPSEVLRVTGDDVFVDTKGGVLNVRGGAQFTITTSGVPRWTSVVDLVQHDAGWAAAAVSIALAPFLFLWWRRSATTFVRVAGIACCAAAGLSVCALVLFGPDGAPPADARTWWTVPVGAALMAAAFLVAPPPSRRDDA
jgi:hypothetical protein